jgi:fructosamine-3-kinase
MDYKVVKRLSGGDENSEVKLVEIEGRHYVLKTSSLRDTLAEEFFHQELAKNRLPSLELFFQLPLEPNQLLLEYIEDSTSLGDKKSAEGIYKWGQLVARMHDIHYAGFRNTTDKGALADTDWNQQLKKYLDESWSDFAEYQQEFNTFEMSKLKQIIDPLVTIQLPYYSLLHGDLHIWNTLIRGEDIVLFDKDAAFLMGSPFFDLSVVLSESFNSCFYVKGENPHYEEDRNYLDAFIDGYGRAVIESNREIIDRYAILRALKRYPHPFINYQLPMMKQILTQL